MRKFILLGFFINAYVKTATSVERCSKFEKTRPAELLCYAHGNIVTKVTLAHLKDKPTKAQPQSSSTFGVSSGVRSAAARFLGGNGSKKLSFVGEKVGNSNFDGKETYLVFKVGDAIFVNDLNSQDKDPIKSIHFSNSKPVCHAFDLDAKEGPDLLIGLNSGDVYSVSLRQQLQHIGKKLIGAPITTRMVLSIIKKASRMSLPILKLVPSFWSLEIGLQTRGLRHEGVDTGPSQVAEEEETLHDLSDSNNKDYFELLKEGNLLKDAFKFAKIPLSFYEAKKTINKLCLDYIKIDVCPNNCTLYWEDDINAESYKHCNTSRWKLKKDSDLDHAPSTKDDNKDGILRHPRDGKAWKRLDTNYPEFASDPRNIQLGLATNGFDPFGTMSTNYSIWPVILFPYNLPPWLCMKQSNFILSMIILGPRTVGNNIDVYLQLLIKELNELWSESVDTFNSSKNEVFKMRATLLWTVSDFPGLDILSGWNTHTGLACPSCNFDAELCRLRHKQSKDHVKARKDLQDMGIRHDLWVDENDECKLVAFAIPKNKKVAFLKTLKNISVPDGYSRNKSQPEGSIAETYIVEESLTIYSCYFEEIESRLNRPKCVNDEPSQNEAYEKSSMFPQQGKHVGGFITEPLTHLEKTQAHRYVLLNCAAVKPFIDEFRDYIKRSTRGRRLSATEVERRVSKEFSDWFPTRYVDDENDKEWCVAVHLKPRELFDMGEIDEEEIYENEPYQQQEFGQFFYVDYENVQIPIEEHMTE
ncbi:putative 13-hydroxylupanine O-tigloyltransferase-like [Capsicum annuum]|nr:putative 13-hydroxylupanine O-tigloyltransferase-like [Capsicum annuum]